MTLLIFEAMPSKGRVPMPNERGGQSLVAGGTKVVCGVTALSPARASTLRVNSDFCSSSPSFGIETLPLRDRDPDVASPVSVTANR